MGAIKERALRLFNKHKSVILWAIGGGINTAFTYVLYLLFKIFLSYQLAFSASYVIGIVFAYFYNTLVAFKSPLSIKKFFQFPLVYLVQYLLSLGLLELFVRKLSINADLAPIFVFVIVTPVTYLLSQFILVGKNNQ